MIIIKEVKNNKKEYLQLLLLADPCEEFEVIWRYYHGNKDDASCVYSN